jgi:hypothetical protein
MRYFSYPTIKMFFLMSMIITSHSLYAGETGIPNPSATKKPNITLENLSKACLPSRIDPDANRDDDNTCHCPTINMCTETVTYRGEIKQKLPDFISTVCCPSPPLPPIVALPPSEKVNPPKNECDITYKNSPLYTDCPARSMIAPRTVRFCSEYSTTNAVNITQIDALNTCLKNTCQSMRDKVFDNYKDPYREKYILDERFTVAEYALQDYAECRIKCFNDNSLNSLLTTSEQTLTQWISRETIYPNSKNDFIQNKYDNIVSKLPYDVGNPLFVNFMEPYLHNYDHMLDEDYDEIDTIMKRLRYAGYAYDAFFDIFLDTKFFPHNVNTMPNQKVWSEFFDNSYNPLKLGYEMEYKKNLGFSIKSFGTSDEGKNDIQYTKDFYGILKHYNYGNFNTLTDDHNKTYDPTLPLPDVTCNQYDDFNVCVQFWSNDGSCRSCLSPETKITLGDTSVKAIKDLKAGDSVKIPHDKTAIIDKVVKIEWPELVLYNINDGALKLTPDHPVMTTKGWRAINYNARKDGHSDERYGLDYDKVDTLKVGDVIVTEQGELPVTRIMPEPTQKNGTTYNLRLKNGKSFYANGLLVKSNR